MKNLGFLALFAFSLAIAAAQFLIMPPSVWPGLSEWLYDSNQFAFERILFGIPLIWLAVVAISFRSYGKASLLLLMELPLIFYYPWFLIIMWFGPGDLIIAAIGHLVSNPETEHRLLSDYGRWLFIGFWATVELMSVLMAWPFRRRAKMLEPK